jgi:hypothetical protein
MMVIRKRTTGLIVATLIVGAVILFAVFNRAGYFADNGGEQSAGDESSYLITERAEVIKVLSDDSIVFKTMPRVSANGESFERDIRDAYYLATGDEAVAVFSLPYKESFVNQAVRSVEIKNGDIIKIYRWGDTKIDYSTKPWSIQCESIEIAS